MTEKHRPGREMETFEGRSASRPVFFPPNVFIYSDEPFSQDDLLKAMDFLWNWWPEKHRNLVNLRLSDLDKLKSKVEGSDEEGVQLVHRDAAETPVDDDDPL